MNSNLPYYEKFLNYFESDTFIKDILKSEEIEADDDDNKNKNSELAFSNNKWYPKKLSWTLNIPVIKLKKDDKYKKLHEFIKIIESTGVITR